jgi:DNA primase
MFYSDDIIEKIRQNCDIVDVVSRVVRLEEKGRNFFGLCPFHAEKTPSFSVNPEKGIFYCFSCNRGGDVFKFVMETEGLDFAGAVQKLAELARVELPEDAAGSRRSAAEAARERERRDRLHAMNAAAAGVFQRTLGGRAGGRAREYLRGRRIGPETAALFGLGYAGAEREGLRRSLLAEGFTDDEQLAGGLILKGKDGGYFDRFRSRVMFPIADVSGRIVAFGGRVMDDAQPKYMNSPETPVYSKGQTLFGLNLAKSTKERFFLIVEGYMDLITLRAHGIDNAIAPLGTALTPAQGKLMKRFRDEAVISFDSDAAGKKAALRGLDILDAEGVDVRVLSLPSGKDPDEFVRNSGAAAFLGLIAGAAPLVDYKLALLEAEHPPQSADGKAKFLSGAVGVLCGIKSSIKRDVYVKKLSAAHGVSEQAIYDELRAADGEARERAAREGMARGGAARGSGAAGGARSAAGSAGGGAQGGARQPGGAAGSAYQPGARGAGGQGGGSGNGQGGGPAAPTRQGAGYGRESGYGPDAGDGRGGGDGPEGQSGAGARGAEGQSGGGGQSGGRGQGGGPQPFGRQRGGAPAAGGRGRPALGDEVALGSADELFVVALIAIDNGLWKTASEKEPPGGFANKNIARAAEYMGKNIESGIPVFAGDVVPFLSPGEADVFAGIVANDCHCENNALALEQKLRDIAAARSRRRMAEIIGMLESGSVPESERERLKEQLAETVAGMRQRRRNP